MARYGKKDYGQVEWKDHGQADKMWPSWAEKPWQRKGRSWPY